MKLTKEQVNIVEHQKGPAFVVAGTGKTHTLCERIKKLVDEGCSPNKIQVLTFTNEANDNIRSKLRNVNGSDKDKRSKYSDVRSSTFHAFGLKIVADNWQALGFSTKPKVVSTKRMDQVIVAIVNKIAVKRGVEKVALKKAVQKARASKSGVELPVAKIKPNLRSSKIATTRAIAKSRAIVEAVAEVLAKVQSYKLRNNLIGYDDMLDLAVELLVLNPEVTDTVSAQIEHLLVDELQDISSKEVSFIYDLAKRVRSTLLVGDKKQAIYKFRGADIKCWDELESRLIKQSGPRSKTRTRLKPELGLGLELKYFYLTKSHRLPEQTMALVNSVGADICDDPQLTSDKQGCVPRLKIAASNDQQSAFVATVIKKLLAKGVEANEIVILGRTKKTLTSMKSHLSHLLKQDNDSVDTVDTLERYRKSRASEKLYIIHSPVIDTKFPSKGKPKRGKQGLVFDEESTFITSYKKHMKRVK